jgi:short-subunit dehydrogenase
MIEEGTRKRALVTGASAGIGESFTRLLAREGYDLVLVARDLDRLKERRDALLSTHPTISIELLSADLSTEEGIAAVEDVVRSGVSVLINNAGFGINKSFTRSHIDHEKDLLSVLVTAPLRLTHTALSASWDQDASAGERDLKIINVSSVASWIAGGTYSAAKSYLTVLSESLHTELAGSSVKVMALCPGFTRTEFHQRGRMKMSGLPKFLWMSADEVTTIAWRDLHAGKPISVPGWHYKIISVIARAAPRPLVRKVGMNLRAKQR